MEIITCFERKGKLCPPTASVSWNWGWDFDEISVNTWKNIITFDFIHLMDKFRMQGNIKIVKYTEWAYTIIVKKFSIEKNCKIRNILFLEIMTS